MSTKRKSRTYTREFKLEVLRLLETSGKTATQLEEELGIGSTNILVERPIVR